VPADEHEDGPAYHRRSFFRKMMIRGIDRAEEAGKNMQRKVTRIFEEPVTYTPPQPYEWKEPPRLLRPPGALPELDFAATCSRCGDCVRACPAQCIVLDESEAGGLPHIKARTSPCVICDDLSCMKACPTGALQMVADRFHINMGYAVADHSQCLRGEAHEYDQETGEPINTGEDCRVCVSMCPIGEKALGLDQYHGMVEVREGCTGCGVCERVCPTTPAAIYVEPTEPVIDFPLYRD
jgi:ferredoxin-type protein NapG